MASITSAQTGLASATSTWVGGVVPVLGDKVTIAPGHAVTLDGAYSWGDDTTTALNINGFLGHSTTVSSSLTVRGQTVIGSAGWWYQGSEVAPIPADISVTWTRNSSAAMANGKYGLTIATGGRLSAWGAEKTRSAMIASTGVSASMTLQSAPTGWRVGDVLFFGPTTPGNTTVEVRSIVSISGTALAVGADLANANFAGRVVANVTRNVRWLLHQPTSFTGMLSVFSTSPLSNRVEVGHIEVVGRGHANNAGAAVSFSGAAPAMKSPVGICVHDVVSVAGASATPVATPLALASSWGLWSTLRDPLSVTNALVCSVSGHTGMAISATGTSSFDSPMVIGCATAFGNASNTGATYTMVVRAPNAYGVNTIVGGTFIGQGEFYGGVFDGYGQITSATLPLTAASVLLSGVNLSGAIGAGIPGGFHLVSSAAGVTLDACPSPVSLSVLRTAQNYSAASLLWKFRLKNRNTDPAAQDLYSATGRVTRDNSVFLRGTSSIRLDPWYSARVLTYTRTFLLQANQSVVLLGAMRVSANYTMTTPPKVSVSGTGIVSQSVSGPTVADTWQDYSLSVTNELDYPTTVTLEYSAETVENTDTVSAWFDGVPDSPWVDSARHYGYVWDTNPYRTPDARITLTEAQALALPVVVDHVAQTITITGTLAPREVFEAAIADLAQTANQGRAVHITSATGETFATTYAVVGTISGPYTDAAGLHVAISAPNLIAQTRVQLLDVGTGTEIHNAQMATNGFSLPLVWTVDRTIRLRAGYAEGAVAKMPIESVGVLTSSGLTFLDAQVDDVVYNAIGLDGGLMTEFAPDYPNLAINVTDPDGITSVQRLYAWAAWSQTSELGIRLMFRAVQASDTANFQIDQSLVDAKLVNANTAPVMMVGGYLTRKDGSTVIAANSGSIQMDPGKAYVAAGNAAEVWSYATRTLTNGQLLLGSGERVLTLAGGEFVARE